jgi:hypothetical protein
MGIGKNTGLCLAQAVDAGGNLIATGCVKAAPVNLTATAVFQGYGGIQLYDISNPARPFRLGTYNTPNSQDVNVALSARYPNPQVPYAASHLALAGNTLYIGWDADGFRVLDISRPTAPREFGSWTQQDVPTGAPLLRAWQVVHHQGLILLNSIGYGVYILKKVP